MERRDFGTTGMRTSILGFGGFHLLEIPCKEASYLLNRYLDEGGNYIETASSYGDGESEMKIGSSVSHRRDEFILATKTGERTAKGCDDSLNRSLLNLQTDHVDIFIMHGVGSVGELDAILGPGGAIEAAEAAREDGRVRFIGISMHGQPDILIKALERYPFDAVMTTINYYDRFNFPEIEEVLIPLAKKKGTAVILMKPIADGYLWKSADKAFSYAFSRDVPVVVSGMNNRRMLEMDIGLAKSFVPMTAREEEKLFKTAPELGGYVCRQCGKCMVCPEGIPIQDIFRLEGYYDRQMHDGIVRDAADYALRQRLRFWFNNRDMAKQGYEMIENKADKCTECGKCMPLCPYGIDIIYKLDVAAYKLSGRKIL
jgi:predicted aldo/keto reductase-like oxidoreductase